MHPIEEYQELRNLRVLWSKGIINRDYIFIPLIITILAISASQFPNFSEDSGFVFLGIEGILLTIAVAYWRHLSRNADTEIVRLYGRMLELEKENGWDIQTNYYYSNIRDEYRKEICDKIGLNDNAAFHEFKQAAEGKCKNKHYDLLIKLWNDHEHESVKTRGHEIHDKFAKSIVIGYWAGLTVFTLWYYSESILAAFSELINFFKLLGS